MRKLRIPLTYTKQPLRGMAPAPVRSLDGLAPAARRRSPHPAPDLRRAGARPVKKTTAPLSTKHTGRICLALKRSTANLRGMLNSLRYALPVVLGLALFSGLSYLLVSATSRGWFEEDVRMRAELALRGARVGVSEGWARGDRAGVERLLTDITKDERVLAAAACAPDSTAFAMTSDFPDALVCRRFAAVSMADGKPRAWSGVDKSGGTSVFLSALPIYTAAGVPLGVVGIIQDMSYIEHRDRVTRSAALWFFGLMSLGALLLSTGIARASFGRFRSELRAIVKGEGDRPEFQPLLRDVRELVLQLATESRAGEGGRAWTPERLREMPREHLRDEKLVIVANREPYIHDRDASGALRVLHPASGLVTALEPVMRACSGTWVAHGSGDADRQTSDRDGRLWVPPEEKSYQLRRIWLSDAEEKGYYYGFANEGLWPLCHVAHARPNFRSDDWAHYERVNRRFADAACAEAASDDPIILVQDYHFALAPRMIRERLPRATIFSFGH